VVTGGHEPGWHVRGYTDPFSVRPGEALSVYVHCEEPEFSLEIVRFLDGQGADGGPAPTKACVHPASDVYVGKPQSSPFGSFAVVPARGDPLPQVRSMAVWIWPTAPRLGRPQGLLAQGTKTGGCGLALDEDGCPALLGWVRGRRRTLVRLALPVQRRTWALIAMVADPDAGSLSLHSLPAGTQASVPVSEPELLDAPAGDFVLGALAHEWHGRARKGIDTYNGKLEDPCVWSATLTHEDLIRVAAADRPSRVAPERVLGAWDFSIGIAGEFVHDVGPHRMVGRTVQAPSRAVTGRLWTGWEQDFRAAPREYAAIHFHDDDLADSSWEATVQVDVPLDWPSGVYGARLSTSAESTYVPFVVRPESGQSVSNVAMILPTFTYLAYANSMNEFELATAERRVGRFEALAARDHRAHLGPSLYDRHGDGSPVYLATRRKPIVEMQPEYRFWRTGLPRHFSLDLAILGWLYREGLEPDVITDADIDQEMAGLIGRYRVLVSGCHPEYVSMRMRAAIDRFVSDGGRLLYLGGNGFHWVVTSVPDRPWLLELRRGVGQWDGLGSCPGEGHDVASGRVGGQWRVLGRSAHALVGVGTTALGWDAGAPYAVTGDGPSWLTAALDAASQRGSIGVSSSGTFGGAAGDEIDRFDPALGSPSGTTVVATSVGRHSSSYSCLADDFDMVPRTLEGDPRFDQLVRADMVLVTNERGGGVFSTGSVAWALGLLRGVDDQSVSAVTSAVLERFRTGALSEEDRRAA
jgi:N,N-dimethylformamidase